MEGYVLIKSSKTGKNELFSKVTKVNRYTRRYLIVDSQSSTLILMDRKPIDESASGDEALAIEIDDEASIVDVIDFQDILNVYWPSLKKNGCRIDLAVHKTDNDDKPRTFKMVVKSASEAQRWVEFITRMLSMAQVRYGRERIKSRGDIDHGGARSRSRSRSNSVEPVGITKRVRAHSVVPANAIIKSQEEVDAVINALDIQTFSLGKKNLTAGKTFSMAATPCESRTRSSEPVPVTGTTRRRDSKTSVKLIITPFKEAVWDLLQLYLSESECYWKCKPLKEYTETVLKNIMKDKIASQTMDGGDIPSLEDDDNLDAGSDYSEAGMHMSDSESDGEVEEFNIMVAKDDDHPSTNDESIDPITALRMHDFMQKLNIDSLVARAKKVITPFSTKFNFKEYTGLIQSAQLMELFCKDGLCESELDGQYIVQELLVKGKLCIFPPRKSRKSAYSADDIYWFPENDASANMAALHATASFSNYDFWINRMKRDLKPTDKVVVGLRTFKDCYRGGSLIKWVQDHSVCEVANISAFLSYLLERRVVIDLLDSKTKTFNLASVFTIHEQKLISDNLDDSITVDHDLKVWAENGSGKDKDKEFMDMVVDKSFRDYFCRLSDDVSLLKVILSVFDKNLTVLIRGEQYHSRGGRRSRSISNYTPSRRGSPSEKSKISGTSHTRGVSASPRITPIGNRPIASYTPPKQGSPTNNPRPKSHMRGASVTPKIAPLVQARTGRRMSHSREKHDSNPSSTNTLFPMDEHQSLISSRSFTPDSFKRHSLIPNKVVLPKPPKHHHVMRELLFTMLLEKSTTTISKVCKVFELDDPEAHGLAVDLIWEILKYNTLKKHFCRNSLQCPVCKSVDLEMLDVTKSFLSGVRCTNREVKQSLLAALIDALWSEVKPVRPLNANVIRPGLWMSFFCALNGAGPALLEEALQDVFSVIIENEHNAFDIIAQDEILDWVLPYTTVYDENFQLCEDVAKAFVARIYYHAALGHKEFPLCLNKLMFRYERIVKADPKAISTTFTVIRMILAFLSKSSNKYPANYSLDRTPFANLITFSKFIISFTMQCSQWGSRPLANNQDCLNFEGDTCYGFQRHRESGLFLFEETSQIFQLAINTFGVLRIPTESSMASLSAQERKFVDKVSPLRNLIESANRLCSTLAIEQKTRIYYSSTFVGTLCEKLIKSKKPLEFLETKLSPMCEAEKLAMYGESRIPVQ